MRCERENKLFGMWNESLMAWTKDQCTQLSSAMIHFPERNNICESQCLMKCKQFTAKNYFTVDLALKSSLNISDFFTSFYGVKNKSAGSLKSAATVNVSIKRNHHQAENKKPASYKYTCHSKIRAVPPC
jgi:hypothetical protein